MKIVSCRQGTLKGKWTAKSQKKYKLKNNKINLSSGALNPAPNVNDDDFEIFRGRLLFMDDVFFTWHKFQSWKD